MNKRSGLLHRLLLAAAVLFTIVCVREAFAHAILFEAIPERNSVISGPSLTVRLRFNVRIDASRSRLALMYPEGGLHILQVRSNEPADIVTAQVANLSTGHYDLKWQVLASDGHITQGDIPFSVK